MSTQDWMLLYAERGWYVFPVWGVDNGKCQCGKPKCNPNDIGKHPCTPHGKDDATTSRETIVNWCKKYPKCNIGVVGGTLSKLVIFDIDPRSGGDESLAKLQEEFGPLPETLTVKSGGNGRHFYFHYPEGHIVFSTSSKLGAGIDVRASVKGNEELGLYVVAPPSNHKSGGVYEWADWETPITTIPQAWLSRLEEAPAAMTWEEGADIMLGQRHDFVIQRTGKLHHQGYQGEELHLIVDLFNQRYCKPPLENEEVRRITKDISLKPVNYFRNTDVGNGQRLAVKYREQLRHCYEMKQWYAWDGTRWARDYGVSIYRAAKVTTKEMWEDAKRIAEPFRTPAIKWARGSQALARVNAMVEMCRTEGMIAVKGAQLDRDKYLFNVRNGTLDLRTGKLKPHNRKDLVTKLAPVDYVPTNNLKKAAWKLWYEYLEEVLGDNMSWVQLAAGYTITGATIMEKAFFMRGTENTGKDTFIGAVTTCMGDYYDIIDPAIFYYRGTVKAGPTPELAKLPGVRMAAATEFKKGMRLSEDKFKRVTGGTEITARSLYGHPFKYWPQFKVWITMNDLPVTDAYGTGIWRRVIVIPFDFKPAKVNYKLKEIFKTDMAVRSVVLDWMVRGSVRWVAGERLEDLAPGVEKATTAYKEGQNPLKNWFEEHYERHDNPVVSKEYPLLGAIQYQMLYDDAVGHCSKHKLYIDHWGFKGFKSFIKQLKILFPWLKIIGDTSKRRLNVRRVVG